MKVKDIMSTSIICARLDTPAHILAKQMKQDNVGIIPICSDSGHVLGVVTDRDIVVRSFRDSEPGKPESVTYENDGAAGKAIEQEYLVTAKDIMTQNVISVTPNTNTHDASLLMAKHQVRRLPVIENGKLVGMLALADIARKRLYVDEAGDALSAISKINGFQ